MVVDVLRYYAGAIDKFFGATVPVDAGGMLTLHERLGVAALITPWNFRSTPPTTTSRRRPPPATRPQAGRDHAAVGAALRGAALEAGIPPGVLNVVTGSGEQVGAAFKRVTLELGGKSACIAFADADLERVGREAWQGALANPGQDCCARSCRPAAPELTARRAARDGRGSPPSRARASSA